MLLLGSFKVKDVSAFWPHCSCLSGKGLPKLYNVSLWKVSLFGMKRLEDILVVVDKTKFHENNSRNLFFFRIKVKKSFFLIDREERQRSEAGLPDFSWSKRTKLRKIYQMTTSDTKRP
jgi:hypothetical protein